jgi:hypothetical protein
MLVACGGRRAWPVATLVLLMYSSTSRASLYLLWLYLLWLYSL